VYHKLLELTEKKRTFSVRTNYTSEFWADGVRPRGLRALADILSKVFQELGGSPISVNDLLK